MPGFVIALPVAEIAVAITLVPDTSARFGAAAALCLLFVFSAAIAVNLWSGRAPECHCFGQIRSGPVGLRTLARNLALAAAAFVTLQNGSSPGQSAVSWWGDLTAAEIAMVVGSAVALTLFVGEGWLIVKLLAQNGRLLKRLDGLESRLSSDTPTAILISPETAPGLPVGVPAPGFTLPVLDGRTHTLDAWRALGKSTLIVFAEPGCGACAELIPEIARWQQQHADKLTIVVVSTGTAQANGSSNANHAPELVLLQRDREVMQAYRAIGTPSAVVVNTDGAIGSPLAQGAAAIRVLVAHAAKAPLLLEMLATRPGRGQPSSP